MSSKMRLLFLLFIFFSAGTSTSNAFNISTASSSLPSLLSDGSPAGIEDGENVKLISSGDAEILLSEPYNLTFSIAKNPTCNNKILVCYEADPSRISPEAIFGECPANHCGFEATFNQGSVKFMGSDYAVPRKRFEGDEATMQYPEMAMKSFNIKVPSCTPVIGENGYIKLKVVEASADCYIDVLKAKVKPPETTTTTTTSTTTTAAPTTSEPISKPTPAEKESSSTDSGSVIAGLPAYVFYIIISGVGVIALGLIIGFPIYFCCCRKKNQEKAKGNKSLSAIVSVSNVHGPTLVAPPPTKYKSPVVVAKPQTPEKAPEPLKPPAIKKLEEKKPVITEAKVAAKSVTDKLLSERCSDFIKHRRTNIKVNIVSNFYEHKAVADSEKLTHPRWGSKLDDFGDLLRVWKVNKKMPIPAPKNAEIYFSALNMMKVEDKNYHLFGNRLAEVINKEAFEIEASPSNDQPPKEKLSKNDIVVRVAVLSYDPIAFELMVDGPPLDFMFELTHCDVCKRPGFKPQYFYDPADLSKNLLYLSANFHMIALSGDAEDPSQAKRLQTVMVVKGGENSGKFPGTADEYRHVNNIKITYIPPKSREVDGTQKDGKPIEVNVQGESKESMELPKSKAKDISGVTAPTQVSTRSQPSIASTQPSLN